MKQNELENLGKLLFKTLVLPQIEKASLPKEDIAKNNISEDKFFSENEFFKKRSFMPKMNIKVNESASHVELELPGLKKEDINIEIKGSTLIISGEKKHEKRTEGDTYTKIESSFGKFSHSFGLENVDKENITASMNDGILEIVLPKVERAEKKIEIK